MVMRRFNTAKVDIIGDYYGNMRYCRICKDITRHRLNFCCNRHKIYKRVKL